MRHDRGRGSKAAGVTKIRGIIPRPKLVSTSQQRKEEEDDDDPADWLAEDLPLLLSAFLAPLVLGTVLGPMIRCPTDVAEAPCQPFGGNARLVLAEG